MKKSKYFFKEISKSLRDTKFLMAIRSRSRNHVIQFDHNISTDITALLGDEDNINMQGDEE